jgi:fimbrial chaperone protein
MSATSSVKPAMGGRGLGLLVSLVLLAGVAPRAFGGAYSVDPVRVSLSARVPLASMTVHNAGSESLVLQVETSGWSQSSGRVTLEPTRDVLATPPLFTIPAGGTQLIRLGLRRAADAQRELAYRVILHEVLAPAPDTKGMRVALDVSIPIFVQSLVPSAPSLQWHLSRSSNRELRLDVANSGTAHIRLETLEVVAADTGRALVMQDLSAYLLANDTRSWTLVSLESSLPTSLGPVIVRAKTDAGNIESRVQLENASTSRDATAPTPVARAP